MDPSTFTYKLLSLIALSGECSPDALPRLGISDSYGEKLITRLKEDGLIKTHYKDRLRGYRLTSKGKRLLLSQSSDRFVFYLTGSTDTNRPRSDYPRRLRLQQASLTYTLLLNAGVTCFRDQKPPIFNDRAPDREPVTLPLPVFYHSRELKELGDEAIKINNSRVMGILLSPKCIYAVFYTGSALMKWEYRTELKVKALLSYHASRGILSKGAVTPWYLPDTPIKALIIGQDMDMGLKLLTSTGGFHKSYFYLDTSFECFHFVPDSPAGETMVKLLCSPKLLAALKKLLLSDLQPPCTDFGLEHDAVSDGLPVLLALDFDMQRISRFHTALSLHGIYGHLLCFDFQRPVLARYFQDSATIETIDLDKFERRFFP